MRILLLLVLSLTMQASQVQRPPVFQRSFEPANDIYGEIAGEIIRETPHFHIYAEKAYVPVDLDWFQAEAETIYSYLSERMGVQATERFALTFRAPDTSPCPIRGLARFDAPVAQAIIYVDAQMSRARISGILAHEVAHLFHTRVLKAGALDMNLSEGFATWAAGKYWQGWQGSPTENVRVFLREKRYKSLEGSYREELDRSRENCLRDRDLRYNSWAAFIDFLIADYGTDKFRRLLGPKEVLTPAKQPSGTPAIINIDPSLLKEFTIALDPSGRTAFLPASNSTATVPVSDFKGVYGLSLDELEKLWLEKLN